MFVQMYGAIQQYQTGLTYHSRLFVLLFLENVSLDTTFLDTVAFLKRMLMATTHAIILPISPITIHPLYSVIPPTVRSWMISR